MAETLQVIFQSAFTYLGTLSLILFIGAVVDRWVKSFISYKVMSLLKKDK